MLTRRVVVSGDLVIEGSLTVQGETDVTKALVGRINELERERELLRDRLESLEKRMEMIWFAPGMPGMCIARDEFEQKYNQPGTEGSPTRPGGWRRR